jgi:hypothetical protein
VFGLRGQGLLWYTFLLIALFLVLSRFQAANALLQSSVKGYIQGVGVLQGRTLSAGGTIGNIAR